MDSSRVYDYIIVGAGTAGCVLANRLTRNSKISVLLVEAGGKDDYLWVHVPIGYLHCIGNPRTDWLFRTEADPGLGGRSLAYPRGRVLGGSSSINGMIYIRGQRQDYDRWASMTGDPGWDWNHVLPLFKRSERHHAGASEAHGGDGEWLVERPRLSWEVLSAFRDAAEQTGIPKISDFNGGDNFGCSYFEVNQRRGVRLSSAKAFLRPALRRGNLTLMTGCHVERLLIEDGECRGVRLASNDGRREVAAARETVLCAGAIGSPQILQLSGVGPAGLLQSCGIDGVLDAPGVGSNLQDHLQLRLIFKVRNARTLNTMVASWHGRARIALEYALFRRGPLSMAPSQLGAFAKSAPSHATPNLQYHVQPISLEKFGDPLHAFPAFTASVCNLRPTSRGHVRVASADCLAAPTITLNYLSTPEDRKVAAEAIRLTRRIVAAPAMARYDPEEFRPGPGYQTDEELAEAAAQIGTTIFHPVGTCRMGLQNDPLAVVDSSLRVLGIRRLRIADASIMPSIPSGNTCAPTIMIAEKAADLLAKEWVQPVDGMAVNVPEGQVDEERGAAFAG